MHYEMRGFARHTVELFRALKEIAGGDIELTSFSPGPIATEFLAELDITPAVFQSQREILWEQVELLHRSAIFLPVLIALDLSLEVAIARDGNRSTTDVSLPILGESLGSRARGLGWRRRRSS
jgi:hypothetical protein